MPITFLIETIDSKVSPKCLGQEFRKSRVSSDRQQLLPGAVSESWKECQVCEFHGYSEGDGFTQRVLVEPHPHPIANISCFFQNLNPCIFNGKMVAQYQGYISWLLFVARFDYMTKFWSMRCKQKYCMADSRNLLSEKLALALGSCSSSLLPSCCLANAKQS